MAICLLTNADIDTQYAGQIVRAFGGSALLAQADTAEHCALLLGARIQDITPGASGYVAGAMPGLRIRMGSEPAVGGEIWLSSTHRGLGVPIAPAIARILGVCYFKEQIGGIWYADVIPEFFASDDASSFHTPLESVSTVAGILTANSKSVLVGGIEDFIGIDSTNWIPGDVLNLVIAGTRTIKHNGAAPAPLYLSKQGGDSFIDLQATGVFRLSFMYSGSVWWQISTPVSE